MRTPIPRSTASVAEGGSQPMAREWLTWLSAQSSRVDSVLFPGLVVMAALSATQLADSANFVQAGTTAGLGVGPYNGWALCNGNNGTTSIPDYSGLALLARVS